MFEGRREKREVWDKNKLGKKRMKEKRREQELNMSEGRKEEAEEGRTGGRKVKQEKERIREGRERREHAYPVKKEGLCMVNTKEASVCMCREREGN